KPGEAGLYADADGALDEAARRGVANDRIALWGTSLGAAVAAEMARRGRGAALVLVSPFTSLPDVAARTAWWLPVSWLLPDRYDTLSKAGAIHVPTTVVHGDRDEVVPFFMGEALARAIPGASFVRVPGATHNDVYDVGGPTLMDSLVAACR
ncbi:MAG TPA: alpha/beta hydrolase, partial [Polyangiaceae bacterium]